MAMAKKHYVGKLQKYGKSSAPLPPSSRRPKMSSGPSASPTLKERAGGFIRGGLANFQENMNARGPGAFDFLGDVKEGLREFQPQRQRSSRSKSGNMDIGPSFMFDSGVDLSMHPDPMYSRMGRGGRSSGRPKKVVRTETTYD